MVNFVISEEKIGTKSGKKQGWCGDGAEPFTWSVRISKYGNQCKYSQKIRRKREKKNRHDVDCC